MKKIRWRSLTCVKGYCYGDGWFYISAPFVKIFNPFFFHYLCSLLFLSGVKRLQIERRCRSSHSTSLRSSVWFVKLARLCRHHRRVQLREIVTNTWSPVSAVGFEKYKGQILKKGTILAEMFFINIQKPISLCTTIVILADWSAEQEAYQRRYCCWACSKKTPVRSNPSR
jgi:hypothetical protein